MDIEKLKSKRQLNVQEQNVLEGHRIYSEADYWRTNGIPIGLQAALESKNVCIAKSVYLNYEQDFPGASTDEGTVLTPDQKFYLFEMDLTKDRSELVEFYLWEEITDKVAINSSKPGTGKTWGYLALQVLSELNQC